MIEIKESYKETEIGVIPEGWGVVQLDKVTKIIDSLHITPKFVDNGISMVRVSDIKLGKLNLEDTFKVTEETFITFTKNYTPKKNDIVLSRVGSYGVSSYVTTDEAFCMGQNTVVINPLINNKFVYYNLNSIKTFKQIEIASYGSGYKSLSLKNIKELKIPLPPLKEQEKIADILSIADKKIDAIASQIQKAETLKKGLLQKLLSEGIPNYGAGTSVPKRENKESWTKVQAPKRKFKDSELGKIPENWEVVELATITTILLSNVDKKSKEDEQDVKLCNYMDVYNNQYITNDLDYMEATAKDNQIEKFQLKINDVIITKDSETKDDIAIPAVIMETFKNLLCGYHLAVLRPKEKVLYGVYLMKAIQYIPVHKHFEKLANGITRFGLTSTSINQALIPLPPLKEQKQIATILSTADEKLEVLRAKKEKYETLKKGLLQKLLSGEVRV